MTTVMVVAKETIPGNVKTRLHPPLSLEQAAELAAASLADTIVVVNALPATRRVLLFEGTHYPDGIEGWDIVPQVSGGLDERLAAGFDEMTGDKLLLLGMDTPQVTVEDVLPVFEDYANEVDAWFGESADGGYWALALSDPKGSLIRGVPMSQEDTGAIQFARLKDAGLWINALPILTDVDTIQDAIKVATFIPETQFARTLMRFLSTC